MKIADINGFSFRIPKNVKYSFFNSPYPPHRLGSGIDVYFEDKALFPFEEGTVEEIKMIRTPQYVPVRRDYLIIFKVEGFCLKVLHVNPRIEKGTRIQFGDEFGDLMVSGFFMPWSDRHAHFELRGCHDRYRARGGLLVKPKSLKTVPVAKENRFVVVERKGNYCWLKPVKSCGRSLTPLTFKGAPLEGGLPHYHYGAVFGKFNVIEILGMRVPIGEHLPNGVGIFNTNFKVLANGRRVKGIGIYCNEQRIKLIGGNFEEEEIVEVEFLRG